MSLQAIIKKRFSGFSLDVSLNTDGGVMGILGASGSGKSMTLKCIAGIETPDEGRIVLNGRVLQIHQLFTVPADLMHSPRVHSMPEHLAT